MNNHHNFTAAMDRLVNKAQVAQIQVVMLEIKNILKAFKQLEKATQCELHQGHCFIDGPSGRDVHCRLGHDEMTLWAKKIFLGQATVYSAPHCLNFDRMLTKKARLLQGNSLNVHVTIKNITPIHSQDKSILVLRSYLCCRCPPTLASVISVLEDRIPESLKEAFLKSQPPKPLVLLGLCSLCLAGRHNPVPHLHIILSAWNFIPTLQVTPYKLLFLQQFDSIQTSKQVAVLGLKREGKETVIEIAATLQRYRKHPKHEDDNEIEIIDLGCKDMINVDGENEVIDGDVEDEGEDNQYLPSAEGEEEISY
ncbi:hypothetical protein SERLA73DRAFT_148987 [Serpula lacrymans var. lacrymans S7.3]|uniref:Uncharacterized protein n=1 Tax=Serpula lacrymans var. lacrymans (strain S7.3) TaxID=936435 RepID=F8PHI1_SERL3|nr:hypothetical protein SERLA73DRAFT_148987 [Serpula lacrymans var. lacrymans S7.3]